MKTTLSLFVSCLLTLGLSFAEAEECLDVSSLIFNEQTFSKKAEVEKIQGIKLNPVIRNRLAWALIQSGQKTEKITELLQVIKAAGIVNSDSDELSRLVQAALLKGTSAEDTSRVIAEVKNRRKFSLNRHFDYRLSEAAIMSGNSADAISSLTKELKSNRVFGFNAFEDSKLIQAALVSGKNSVDPVINLLKDFKANRKCRSHATVKAMLAEAALISNNGADAACKIMNEVRAELPWGYSAEVQHRVMQARLLSGYSTAAIMALSEKMHSKGGWGRDLKENSKFIVAAAEASSYCKAVLSGGVQAIQTANDTNINKKQLQNTRSSSKIRKFLDEWVERIADDQKSDTSTVAPAKKQ